MKKPYPTYYDTLVNNRHWQKWGEVAEEHGFDWHESVECGWLSEEHFQAFLDWYFEERACLCSKDGFLDNGIDTYNCPIHNNP